MNQRDRVRGAGLLCCHCVRNSAYYRAGWRDGHFVSQLDFWRNANGNFIDIAVLEWCKLFADRNGKHHWRKVVPDPDGFLPGLFGSIGVSEEAFNSLCEETRTYRDKFIAHLDEGRLMHIPRLNVIIDSSIFLYGLIRTEYQQFLGDAPPDLRQFYEERLAEATGVYPNAT
ncbi:hypothetical protein ABC977_14420 [Thioalkalicoccus limnaeus]|uniref:Uncharacterized protein n=1 Tax=Thioalkalicoccus limnaeus TaxID=120681 RepID=A0ABV4BH31_9GAMM